ncbi:MAG: DUF4331 domain-containing protein [Deltaproteobacteria bacterium]|nr:DUF4331 domain-containing protein [Deltaproteobacteria bacterium]
MRPKLVAVSAAIVTCLVVPGAGRAASHREAPLISNDPAADNTDTYFFRSWENPANLVMVLSVIPSQEPSAGPNYFNFDDEVVYRFSLDTNQDGEAEDVVYEIVFETEIRDPFKDLPVAYAGVDGVPGLPPAITALDGPGSEGLGLRQRYTVTKVTGSKKSDRTDLGVGPMFAVPSNIGPRTMPDYESLAEKGHYALGNGGRIFAGQRDETFYIDLGATFDTLNFRATPPILAPANDANDGANPFGVDMFSGFNVNSIVLEVPIAEITSDAGAVIGMYASTSRSRSTRRRGAPDRIRERDDGSTLVVGRKEKVQVSRLANPLVNELLIGTGSKDVWNATEPSDEGRFVDFYLNPRLVAVVNTAFGTAFPTTNRTDLVAALLKYPGQDPAVCSKDDPCAELLRLNVGVPPTAPAAQKRLGGLAGDAAGFPNGRRPNDDVTDIVLRVAAGALLGPVPALGDGAHFNIGAPGTSVTANGIATSFPYQPTPHDGRNRRHLDPGE